MSDKLRMVSSEKETADQQAVELRQQLTELTEQREATSAQVSELRETARETLAKHEDELLQLREAHAQEKAAAQQLLDDLQAQLRRSRDDAEATSSSFESRLQELNIDLEKERAEGQAARDRIENLSAALEEARDRGSVFEQRQREFDHIVGQLRGDLERAISDKATADQIAHECRVELKELQEAVRQPEEPTIQRAQQQELQSAVPERTGESGTEGRWTTPDETDAGASALRSRVEKLEAENRALESTVKDLEIFRLNSENIMQGLQQDLHSALHDKRALTAQLRDLRIQVPSRASLAPMVFPVEIKQIHEKPAPGGLGTSALPLLNLVSEKPQEGGACGAPTWAAFSPNLTKRNVYVR